MEAVCSSELTRLHNVHRYGEANRYILVIVLSNAKNATKLTEKCRRDYHYHVRNFTIIIVSISTSVTQSHQEGSEISVHLIRLTK